MASPARVKFPRSAALTKVRSSSVGMLVIEHYIWGVVNGKKLSDLQVKYDLMGTERSNRRRVTGFSSY